MPVTMKWLCKCGKRLVQPTGPENAKVLFVGDVPGFEELKTCLVFVGPTGRVLDKELERVGLARPTLRVTNLWQHAEVKKNEQEKGLHLARLKKELQGRQAAFFMGAGCAWEFAGLGVTEISGVAVYPKGSRKEGYKSGLLPAHLKLAVFAPNPAVALQRSKMAVIGEFRDALEFFVAQCKKEGWL